MGYFQNKDRTHDKLNFDDSVFVHFHLLVSYIDAQFNLSFI